MKNKDEVLQEILNQCISCYRAEYMSEIRERWLALIEVITKMIAGKK